MAGDAAGWSNLTDGFVAKDREGCLTLGYFSSKPNRRAPPLWGESTLEGPAVQDKEALLEPFQPPTLPLQLFTHEFLCCGPKSVGSPPYHFWRGICWGVKQQVLLRGSARSVTGARKHCCPRQPCPCQPHTVAEAGWVDGWTDLTMRWIMKTVCLKKAHAGSRNYFLNTWNINMNYFLGHSFTILSFTYENTIIWLFFIIQWEIKWYKDQLIHSLHFEQEALWNSKMKLGFFF